MRSIRVALLVGACLGLAVPAAHGVELSAPRLLGDLVPGVSTVPFRWEPYPLAAAGGRMLFDPYLADGGSELWSSDGTPQGTGPILPADAGSVVFAWEQGDEAVVLVEERDGAKLLRTDGTVAGTVTVASWPGYDSIGWYGRSDGRTWVAPCHYGEADYSADRCELWKVDDGAPVAEKLADDLPLQYQCCSPMEQLVVDGRLFFFTVENGDTTLWRSDGTAATTVPLVHLPPESFVYPLGRGGRRVVFGADLADGRSQVWTSDGTAEGTREMVRLPSFPWEAGWDWYYRKQGPFFFTAREPATRTTGLWAVGPAGKARRLGSFAQIEGDVHAIGSGPTARYLFAAARNPPAPGEPARLRLWITDGTPAGTMELRIPGGPLLVEHTAGIAAGRFYFTANDGTSGVEPWTTDGTGAGTRRLADTCPGPCSSRIDGVASIGATVLLIVDRGGEQMLWRSDGTSASPVAPITGGDAAFSLVGDPFAPAAGGHAFFSVGAANRFALWATDGTAAGTGPVASGATAALGSDPAPLAVSAQSLLFAAVDPLDDERRRLYLQRRGEALPGGVRLPEYVQPTAGVIDDARGLALFVGSRGSYSSQLWATDGTAGGTVQLTTFGVLGFVSPDALTGDKYYDECYDTVELPQRSGDRWLFIAHICSSGVEVWSTDGSLAGTHRTTLLPDDAFAPVLVGDGMFYLATVETDDGAEETQLFHRSLAGGEAVQLTQRAGGLSQFGRRWAAPALRGLFFDVANGEGSELWVSDGTVTGTGAVTGAPEGTPLENVKEVAAGPGFALAWAGSGEFASTLFTIAPASRAATPLPGLRVFESFRWAVSPAGVFFAAWDAQHGWEPWISDGTAAGTRVLDVVPGPASSGPHGFAASDAGVFFAARGPETGDELWIADPGGAGARPVADLAPGWLSSRPSDLVAGPGGLLFTADDGATGREPWLLEWTPPSAGAAAAWGVR